MFLDLFLLAFAARGAFVLFSPVIALMGDATLVGAIAGGAGDARTRLLASLEEDSTKMQGEDSTKNACPSLLACPSLPDSMRVSPAR